jgi:hypothetical protein
MAAISQTQVRQGPLCSCVSAASWRAARDDRAAYGSSTVQGPQAHADVACTGPHHPLARPHVMKQ